jgi:hypothetical protein
MPHGRARHLLRATLQCLLPAGWLLSTACLPYGVGATAGTVRPGVTTSTVTFSSVGSAGSLRNDGFRLPAFDSEYRTGLDARTDYGLRITSMSGLVGSYKRRIAGEDTRAGVALQAEVGVVNFGSHAMAGGTLIVSGNEFASAVGFSGVRILAVTPMSAGAVYDSPTAGAFLGIRFRDGPIVVSPELGVFYDRSALRIRRSNWILVPSISVRAPERRRRF